MSESAKVDTEGFDWVTERSLCSLPKVYEKLRLDIQRDVKTRNALRSPTEQYVFETVGNGGSFAVLLHANKVHKSITFSLGDKCIEVQNENAKMFDATVGLNDDGECMLLVNGQERRLWQVRKLALEQLFFGVF
jgi:hypothetical protein